jgi:hypothetical protein
MLKIITLRKGKFFLNDLTKEEKKEIDSVTNTKNNFLKGFSAQKTYNLFNQILKKSNSKKMKIYAHFRLECLTWGYYGHELKRQGINIKFHYHYNQLFKKKFQKIENEIHKFLPFLRSACRIIRPWAKKEKGILISNFLDNNWEKRRKFFKKYYFIFNSSCCSHIHHIEKRYLKDIDMLLVTDFWKKKDFEKSNPKIPCYIIPHAFFVDLKKFKPKKTTKKYDMVYIMTFRKNKRVPLLMDVLSEINENLRCVLISGGYCDEPRIRREVEKLIEKYNLNVKILEKLPHNKVVENVQKSKIGVNLCDRSGFDRSVAECFACNLPVLYTYDNPCGKWAINDQTGIIVNSSVSEIIRGIKKLLKERSSFSPRKWLLDNNWGQDDANRKLKKAIRECGYGSTKRVYYAVGEKGGSCVGTFL